MKKTILGSLFSCVLAFSVMGQGQVDFRNSNLTSPGNRFVFDNNGTTKLATSSFLAQLYYSTTGINGTFLSITDPAAPFRNVGQGDGFWNPGASFLRSIPGTVGSQSVALMVRVWQASAGSTYELASGVDGAHVGSSTPFSYVLGGDPGNGNPSTTAPAMSGFQSFNLSIVSVPEPSTYALMGMAAGSLWMIRRRRA